MTAERRDADIGKLARAWYQADQQALYGHSGAWYDAEREERLAYREAVERLMPAVQQLLARAWYEGWRSGRGRGAGLTSSRGRGDNPYRAAPAGQCEHSATHYTPDVGQSCAWCGSAAPWGGTA